MWFWKRQSKWVSLIDHFRELSPLLVCCAQGYLWTHKSTLCQRRINGKVPLLGPARPFHNETLYTRLLMSLNRGAEPGKVPTLARNRELQHDHYTWLLEQSMYVHLHTWEMDNQHKLEPDHSKHTKNTFITIWWNTYFHVPAITANRLCNVDVLRYSDKRVWHPSREIQTSTWHLSFTGCGGYCNNLRSWLQW